MIALAAGCGPRTQQVRIESAPVAGGFLPEPSLLQRGKEGQLDLVYFNPDANLSVYKKFILKPVSIWAAPGSEISEIPPAQQEAMANSLHAKLYKAFSEVCKPATEPGPDTFIFRVALVDARQSDAVMRAISTWIPPVEGIGPGPPAEHADGVSAWAGEATAEAYAIDSLTGKLLWQGADRRAGADALGTDTLNSWADVDAAGTAWAEHAAKRLGQVVRKGAA
jgi:hypothetical protein